MNKKAGGNEFIKGLLERIGADSNTSNFHTSAFKHTFQGIKERFRELK
jgi:hypothetical protein